MNEFDRPVLDIEKSKRKNQHSQRRTELQLKDIHEEFRTKEFNDHEMKSVSKVWSDIDNEDKSHL